MTTTSVTPQWLVEIKGRNPALIGLKHSIYMFINANPGCTRNDVAKKLGMKSSTCTARIKELIDLGLVIEHGEVKSTYGVTNAMLFASKEMLHRVPKDSVKIEVFLMIDEQGNYFAEAKVVEGVPKKFAKKPRKIASKTIKMLAPYPNDYRHLFVKDTVSKYCPRKDQLLSVENVIDIK
jgi:predicted transcriptional regulator